MKPIKIVNEHIVGIEKGDIIKISPKFVVDGKDTIKPYNHNDRYCGGLILEKDIRKTPEYFEIDGVVTIFNNYVYLIDHVVRNGVKLEVESPYKDITPKYLSNEETSELKEKLILSHPWEKEVGIQTTTKWYNKGGYQWYLQVRPSKNKNGAGEWTDCDVSYQQVTSPWDNIFIPYGLIPYGV